MTQQNDGLTKEWVSFDYGNVWCILVSMLNLYVHLVYTDQASSFKPCMQHRHSVKVHHYYINLPPGVSIWCNYPMTDPWDWPDIFAYMNG